MRENTVALRPPRALWVSFPLGRPLGVPGDAAFQHRVIAAGLSLLQAPSGPVLEDHTEDMPPGWVGNETGSACPVEFAQPARVPDSWTGRLSAELQQLVPWYELSLRRRDRTTFGLAGLEMRQIVHHLGRLLDGSDTEVGDLRSFKYMLEDAKAYYTEALTARPGVHPPDAVAQWLYKDSCLGQGIVTLYHRFAADPATAGFARIVSPRVALGHTTGDDQIDRPEGER
ncbi:MAG: hypothetical protein AAF513_19830 [Pseudomonadota bacterium]